MPNKISGVYLGAAKTVAATVISIETLTRSLDIQITSREKLLLVFLITALRVLEEIGHITINIVVERRKNGNGIKTT